jgi:hypothetical protein
VAPAIVAVFTVPAAAAAGLLVLLPGEAPAELHATRAAAAAIAAGSARSSRRRAGLVLIRRALSLPPRPGFFRVVMISCPLWRVSPGQLVGAQALLMLRNAGREYHPPNV